LLLTAVGNGGHAVVYGAENLPTWAVLSGDFLAFSPSSADAGTYDITITAWAGAAADSKQLRLLVEVRNHPPETPYGWVSDAINPTGMLRAGSPCMLDPIVRMTSHDPDGDRLRLEIEAVPHGTEFTRTPTLTIDGPDNLPAVPPSPSQLRTEEGARAAVLNLRCGPPRPSLQESASAAFRR
jgi:hypothetical protein